MRILLVLATALALTACQCGPGISCSDNEICQPWGVCGSNGYCIARSSQSDGGAPRAVVPAAMVDLALVGCENTKTQTITITNAGTGTLHFSTMVVNGAVFSVAPTMGDLNEGETAELNVSGKTPKGTMNGAELVGVLTLNINEQGRSKIDVPLKLKAFGATLTLAPSVASFGSAQIGDSAQSLPLTLTNIGNSPATLTFTQPTDDQFALIWDAQDAGPTVTVAPGASVPGLQATFVAKRILPSSSLSLITFPEPVCGSGVETIPMTGRGLNGAMELSDTDLIFGTAGRVNCGATAAPKTFVIRNTGNQVFSWTGVLAKGGTSPFTVTPPMGTVFSGPDAGMVVTVTPAAIPVTASTAGDAFGDTFTITTSISGDSPHTVGLHQTANGAVLSYSTPAIDFGLVSVGETANAPVSVVNDGNTNAVVVFTSNKPKFTVSPGFVQADGGGSSGVTVSFSPDASIGEEAATLAMSLDAGILCAPLPPSLVLSGAGSTGSVSFTPAALDFGQVSCGTTAAPKAVTFKNNGNQSYTVTPRLSITDGGSRYTLAMSPVNGVVAPDGGTVVITVSPKQIPQTSPVTLNLYGETLIVDSDVLNDPDRLIPLSMTARGSIFGISTSTVSFGSIAVGGVGSSQFTVDNKGNAPGTIDFKPGQPLVFSTPRDAGIAANATFIATATFTPQTTGTATDTIAISVPASTVLCQPLPFPSMTLSGTGTTSNALSLSTQSLTFGSAGLVPCGTTAAPRTILVTNNSAQNLVLTLRLGIADGGSPYTVSGPAMLAAFDGGVVTVTPKPMGTTSSTAPDFYQDTLQITGVGAPVNETQVVALHQTAEGAVLSFNPTALAFSAGLLETQSKNFTVNNVGNLAAPYTLAISGPNANVFTVTPTSSTVAPGGGVTETAKFSGELLSPSRSAVVNLTSPVAQCAPLPAPLTLQGN